MYISFLGNCCTGNLHNFILGQQLIQEKNLKLKKVTENYMKYEFINKWFTIIGLRLM